MAAAAATVFWRRKRGQQSRRLRQHQREEKNSSGQRKRRPRERAAAMCGRKGGKEERRKGRFSRRKQRRIEERAAVVAGSRQRRQAMGRRRRRRMATASGKEAREECEGSGSLVRATAAREGGGCDVSVRSAQRWLWLRAREAAALAGGRSRGERMGLCAGGAVAVVEMQGKEEMAGGVGLQAADGGGSGNRQRHECAAAAGSRGDAALRRCRRRSGWQQRALRHGCAPARKLLRAGTSTMGSTDVAASGEDDSAAADG
ncbi:hypothetical protein BHM03_00037876 [Ensete ventricosum]|nr:hypothetical protein BHM03_00037876 [Ensete ventricosum]